MPARMMNEEENLQAVRELMRRAILTLAAVPDPDIRYRFAPRGSWPDFVRQARDAYGSTPPRYVRFQPTRHDLSIFLTVVGWMDWYERSYPQTGPQTARIFTAWTFGASMWQLQMRCTTNRRDPASVQTVHNRMNGMLRTIAGQFEREIAEISFDRLDEVDKFSATQGYGGKSADTDLRDLPNSPKAWKSALSEPLTAKEKRKIRADLVKRLEKNRLKEIGRKQRAGA